MALRGDGAHPRVPIPMWVSVLQMAREWGVPPWEIMQAEGSLQWMARWKFYIAQEEFVKRQLSEK